MKWIYYAVLAYLAYSFWKIVRAFRRRMSGPSAKPRSSGLMVKDETCGIYLPREQALKETIDGEDHFFCSTECRAKFLGSRERR